MSILMFNDFESPISVLGVWRPHVCSKNFVFNVLLNLLFYCQIWICPFAHLRRLLFCVMFLYSICNKTHHVLARSGPAHFQATKQAYVMWSEFHIFEFGPSYLNVPRLFHIEIINVDVFDIKISMTFIKFQMVFIKFLSSEDHRELLRAQFQAFFYLIRFDPIWSAHFQVSKQAYAMWASILFYLIRFVRFRFRCSTILNWGLQCCLKWGPRLCP